MGAVWMRVRAEVRSRWRALFALSLLAGIPAGIAIAAASGASRTETVIDRLIAATKPPLVYMIPGLSGSTVKFADIARLPTVSQATLYHGFAVVTPGREDVEPGAPAGVEVQGYRDHLLSGRRPREGSTDEAIINFVAADRFHWKIDDVVPLTLAAAGSDLFSGEELNPGPTVRARIVGIYANPGDFVGIAGPAMEFGLAFDRAYAKTAASYDFYTFSLHRGAADIPQFEREVRKLTGGELPVGAYGDAGAGQVRRTFHIRATAMWLLCILIGLVAGFIFTQAFVRQTLLESNDQGVLRALGMRRRDLRLVTAVRGVIVVVVAVAIAAVVGFLLSYFTPLGAPRLAEPHPGFWISLRTYGLGLVLVLVSGLLLAIPPSLIAARDVTGEGRSLERPSSIARLVGGIIGRPAPAVGARFALEPGRGASAVPVRSSLATAITGIVALVAALIVAASLSHLLVTPPLYGHNWDTILTGSFEAGSADLRDLEHDPAVAEFSVGGGGDGFRVGRLVTAGIAAERVKGDVQPTLVSGRAPRAADEVALGPKIAQALHLHLGSSVVVGNRDGTGTQKMRVVGEVVLPFDDDTSTVGEGLWMTLAGRRVISPGARAEAAAIRLVPGVDKAKSLARLKERFPGESLSDQVPRTVRDFGRMSNLPTVLAALLAALAAGTLAHMLATSIRRRRRDLAIMKTIGFSRGQVRSAVEWQATIFTAVALAIAVPLGIIVGRWTWTLIARYGGFAPSPAVPGLPIAITAMAALAAAAVLAALPARAAARTPPALVLRTE